MVPLLLIHGTGGDAASWSDVVPLLSPHYRVIAYDRRGYGRAHADHAADALAILDAQAPGEEAIVVGSSAGAIVALHFAIQYPDRVRALVLAEPPMWARNTFDLGMLGSMVGYAWNLARGRRREAVAAFFRAVTRYRDRGNGFDALSPQRRERILAHADDVIAEIKTGTGEDLAPEWLLTILCPITLLLGARSAPVFTRMTERLADALLNARIVRVDGAGHLMMMEQPRAFADAVIAADTAQRSSPAA